MKDVVLVGEPMGMFIAAEYGHLFEVENYTRGVAGAEVNVGIGLSRLNYEVEFVSKLGEDLLGKSIENFLKNEDLKTNFVTFDKNHITALQMKNKVEKGDPEVEYFRKNSAFTTLSIEDVDNIDFSEVRLFHVTGIPPAVSLSARESIRYLIQKARENNCYITFDPNLRPSLWENKETMISVINEIAGHADLVLPGISEGELLTGSADPQDIADFYLSKGVKSVIIKNGADGAVIAEQNKEIEYVPGFKVDKVIDTVGAGDGFAVGIISGLLDNISLKDAAVRANAIGSLQVQHIGDNEGMPSRSSLENYLKEKVIS